MFVEIPERKGLCFSGGAKDQLREKCVAVIKPNYLLVQLKPTQIQLLK